jgi:putative hydrolase of the HAD superfamily
MVILFDLDDTLVDHAGAASVAIRALYAAHGAPLGLSASDFTERWLALTEQAMDAFARGELSMVGQRRFRVRAMFDATLSDDAADALYRAYLEVYQRSWQLFSDVVPCLEALGGHRLGVITNGSREQQHNKLATTGIAHRFEVVLTPEPPLRGKPAPDLFFAAAAGLRVHPRDCVVVGDHLDRDVLAAERAGMTGVWLTREGVPVSADAAGVQRIRSLEELAALL